MRKDSNLELSSHLLPLVDHELRTMLNAIIGMTQIMQTSKNLTTDSLKDCIKSVHQSGIDLLAFLNNVSDFSHLQQQRLKTETHAIDFTELLTDVARGLNITAKNKNIGFNVNYAADAPQVIYGDPQRIRQILRHLLDNAFKFTTRGEININVSNEIDKKTQRTFAKISISDTGIGIAKQKLPLVFDEFTQVYTPDQEDLHSKGYEGLGLGLTIAKKLVELQGGKITLSSQLGKGTTATFTLPATAEMSTTLLANITKKLGHLRLLLVDDDHVNCEVLRHQLNTMGIRCTTSSLNNAINVMQEAQQQSNAFHIVVVQTPQLNQYATYLARTIQSTIAMSPALLVLALPSEQYDYEQERALMSGFNAVISSHQPILFAETLANTWHSWTHKENFSAATKANDPRKVLLVEDNLLNQKVAKLMLTELGCDVETVNTGNDALSALKQNNYGMIFMDIGLPDISGLDIISILRRSEHAYQRTPVVALTADAQLGDAETIENRGIDAYIVKPLDLEQLKGIVTRYLPNHQES